MAAISSSSSALLTSVPATVVSEEAAAASSSPPRVVHGLSRDSPTWPTFRIASDVVGGLDIARAVLHGKEHVLLIGDAACGKTRFMRAMYDTLKSMPSMSAPGVVVYIEAAAMWPRSVPGATDSVMVRLSGDPRVSDIRALFVDGLDRMRSIKRRTQLLGWLYQQASDHGIRLVISTRPIVFIKSADLFAGMPFVAYHMQHLERPAAEQFWEWLIPSVYRDPHLWRGSTPPPPVPPPAPALAYSVRRSYRPTPLNLLLLQMAITDAKNRGFDDMELPTSELGLHLRALVAWIYRWLHQTGGMPSDAMPTAMEMILKLLCAYAYVDHRVEDGGIRRIAIELMSKRWAALGIPGLADPEGAIELMDLDMDIFGEPLCAYFLSDLRAGFRREIMTELLTKIEEKDIGFDWNASAFLFDPSGWWLRIYQLHHDDDHISGWYGFVSVLLRLRVLPLVPLPDFRDRPCEKELLLQLISLSAYGIYMHISGYYHDLPHMSMCGFELLDDAFQKWSSMWSGRDAPSDPIARKFSSNECDIAREIFLQLKCAIVEAAVPESPYYLGTDYRGHSKPADAKVQRSNTRPTGPPRPIVGYCPFDDWLKEEMRKYGVAKEIKDTQKQVDIADPRWYATAKADAERAKVAQEVLRLAERKRADEEAKASEEAVRAEAAKPENIAKAEAKAAARAKALDEIRKVLSAPPLSASQPPPPPRPPKAEDDDEGKAIKDAADEWFTATKAVTAAVVATAGFDVPLDSHDNILLLMELVTLMQRRPRICVHLHPILKVNVALIQIGEVASLHVPPMVPPADGETILDCPMHDASEFQVDADGNMLWADVPTATDAKTEVKHDGPLTLAMSWVHRDFIARMGLDLRTSKSIPDSAVFWPGALRRHMEIQGDLSAGGWSRLGRVGAVLLYGGIMEPDVMATRVINSVHKVEAKMDQLMAKWDTKRAYDGQVIVKKMTSLFDINGGYEAILPGGEGTKAVGDPIWLVMQVDAFNRLMACVPLKTPQGIVNIPSVMMEAFYKDPAKFAPYFKEPVTMILLMYRAAAIRTSMHTSSAAAPPKKGEEERKKQKKATTPVSAVPTAAAVPGPTTSAPTAVVAPLPSSSSSSSSSVSR